jgi:hypothetical protein
MLIFILCLYFGKNTFFKIPFKYTFHMYVHYTHSTLHRNVETCIPRNETGWPRSQLILHSYLCERFIYSRDRTACCRIAFADRSWQCIKHSQIHECRNCERGRLVLYQGIFYSNFRYSAFAVYDNNLVRITSYFSKNKSFFLSL